MALPPWHAHPDVWLLMGGLEAAYLLSVGRERLRDGGGRRKAVFFSLGMLTLWVAADWPIHDLAERYLYSVHMVQHLLFSLVAAPLLIAGLPAWMLRKMLASKSVFAVVRFLTRPIVALLLFNAVLLFTHWPAVVEASVRSEGIHFSLHLLLVSSALVMWWPVMSPLPELPPLAPPMQMLYLFFQSLAPTIPASWLTFGSTALYPVYASFPRIWGISVMTDQMIAGIIMKLAGGAILWAFIAVIFFRWYSRESRDGMDPTQWRNVEADVRSGLMRP